MDIETKDLEKKTRKAEKKQKKEKEKLLKSKLRREAKIDMEFKGAQHLKMNNLLNQKINQSYSIKTL